jgi:magnesium transporter
MEIYNISDNVLRVASFKDFARDKEQHFWIIANPDEILQHNDIFKFHISTIEECKNGKQHTRLEVYDELSFGVINIIDRAGNGFEAKEINFYFKTNYLIFVTKSKNRLIEQIKNDISKNTKTSTNYNLNESKILYMLLDKLTLMDNVILKKIESSIAVLEEQVISGVEMDFTVEIIKLRKQLLYLKRYYEPLIDIAEDLEDNESGLIDDGAMRYFKMLINRIQRLNNNVIHLRDYVTQVREAYQAQQDIKLNNTMKLFTVITTIFMPLTLIVGWYGMNFTHMPEIKSIYGYPSVIALSLAVVAVCLVYFRKHDYL